MDDYFMMERHAPAFGSWDSGDYLPFTDCFESARHGRLVQYAYPDDVGPHSGDLCVTGDLYQNDVVTPAMIVVPHHRSKSRGRVADGKQAKKQAIWGSMNSSESHLQSPHDITPSRMRAVKPVDEDLYKISPELIYNTAKKRRGLGFFARCCLVLNCAT